MADEGIPISTLPAATSSGSTDVVPVVQGGVTKKMALSLVGLSIGYATRTLLAAIASPTNGQVAYLAEAGREGWFKFSTANLSTSVTADPRQGAIVPPAAAPTGASGAWVRAETWEGYNVRWFGAVGDNVTDDLLPIQAAINWSDFLKLSGGYGNGGGPRVRIPTGKYYLSDTLSINHTFILEGDSQGVAGGAPTQLRWPVDKCGIKCEQLAFGFIVQNLFLTAPAGSLNLLYPGIWARGKGTIRDCFISGFSGPGIYWDGVTTNCNSWRLDGCRIQGTPHSAVFVDGPDSNAGLATGLDIGDCDRYGIEDSSFLGNQWYFSNIDTCTLGPYIAVDPNALSVFGGYTETGLPAGNLGAHSLAWGPQFSGTTGGAGLLAQGLDGGGLSSSTGFYVRRAGPSTAIIRAIWGTDPSSNSSIATIDYAGDGSNYTYLWRTVVGASGISNKFTNDTGDGVFWQGPSSGAAYNFGRTTNEAYAVNIGRFWPGVGNAARQIDSKSAAPTSGEFALGDTVINNGATSTSNFAWTCTTAGGIGTVAWAGSTAYLIGNLRTNDGGKTYVCTTAGTSASSGGPTGTGTGIADGTCVWNYLAAFTFTAQYALASRTTTASGLTMSTARILGRTTASSGAIEEITVGNGLAMAAGNLAVTPAAAQADSTAAVLADLVTDFNALLGKMRAANLLAP